MYEEMESFLVNLILTSEMDLGEVETAFFDKYEKESESGKVWLNVLEDMPELN